jgi:hypothetical protein
LAKPAARSRVDFVTVHSRRRSSDSATASIRLTRRGPPPSRGASISRTPPGQQTRGRVHVVEAVDVVEATAYKEEPPHAEQASRPGIRSQHNVGDGE